MSCVLLTSGLESKEAALRLQILIYYQTGKLKNKI